MSVYYPPVEEHENVIKAALRVIGSTHYQRADDPHADAEQQYGQEQLALAARALVEAVDRKSADEQPVGWVAGTEEPAATEVEALRQLVKDLADPGPCYFDHHGYCQAHGWTDTDPSCPHGRAQQLFPGIRGPE